MVQGTRFELADTAQSNLSKSVPQRRDGATTHVLADGDTVVCVPIFHSSYGVSTANVICRSRVFSRYSRNDAENHRKIIDFAVEMKV